jgi:hypothetical protein
MNLNITNVHSENKIFSIRGFQVMIDRDLSELYQVETKVLNQAVKRNIERFPINFRFQLTDFEQNELVTICDRFKNLKHSSSLSYVFTEQGVAMLSAVLKSDIAVQVSIQIINAFVACRKLMNENSLLEDRLYKIETKLLKADDKFEQIFAALENKNSLPDKGVFFNGQIFDAWNLLSDFIRKAEKSILIIDNYLDDSILKLLSKRKSGVQVIIYTQKITAQMEMDLKKYNAQFEPIEIKLLANAHDRFLILDNKELYHIGASLKDLGKKWFAFSKMDVITPEILLRLKQI